MGYEDIIQQTRSKEECKEEETGIEVAVTSTTGSSNEVLVGSNHPESQSDEKVDINFQIFS